MLTPLRGTFAVELLLGHSSMKKHGKHYASSVRERQELWNDAVQHVEASVARSPS